jgi:hypothetical protein
MIKNYITLFQSRNYYILYKFILVIYMLLHWVDISDLIPVWISLLLTNRLCLIYFGSRYSRFLLCHAKKYESENERCAFLTVPVRFHP